MQEHLKEKRILEDIRDQQARKLQDNERIIRQLEGEADRVKGEYDRLTGLLHNNIQRTISQTVSENFGFRPNDVPARP
jgi:hypothetical protein